MNFIEEINSSFIGLENYSLESKVWVYYSTESFENDITPIQDIVSEFITNWKSHGQPIKGNGFIIGNQSIVLTADVIESEVSGCATDSSVRMIKLIEEKFKLNFFDRIYAYYLLDNTIKRIAIADIKTLEPDTQVFNPFFNNLKEWKTNFLQSLDQSKYKRLIN